MDELIRLRARECWLLLEINKFPEESEWKRRRELQDELEAVLHQHAELGELYRIEMVRDDAVESKRIVSPTQRFDDIGECPVCLEDIIKQPVRHDSSHNIARLSCCGGVMCYGCHDAIIEKRSTNACPLCQARVKVKLAVRCSQLLQQAKAGKSWAQCEIGRRFLVDNTWSKDAAAAPMTAPKALEWLKIAAEQDDADANDLLSTLYASD